MIFSESLVRLPLVREDGMCNPPSHPPSTPYIYIYIYYICIYIYYIYTYIYIYIYIPGYPAPLRTDIWHQSLTQAHLKGKGLFFFKKNFLDFVGKLSVFNQQKTWFFTNSLAPWPEFIVVVCRQYKPLRIHTLKLARTCPVPAPAAARCCL